jgi:hypothetical protein
MREGRGMKWMERRPPETGAEAYAAEWRRTYRRARVRGRMMNYRVLGEARYGCKQSAASKEERAQRNSIRISHDGLTRVSRHD